MTVATTDRVMLPNIYEHAIEVECTAYYYKQMCMLYVVCVQYTLVQALMLVVFHILA